MFLQILYTCSLIIKRASKFPTTIKNLSISPIVLRVGFMHFKAVMGYINTYACIP